LQRRCVECDECDTGEKPSARQVVQPAEPAPVAFLGPGWKDINEPGVVYKEGTEAEKGGAYLRDRPVPHADPPLAWLPQNSTVNILKHNDAESWYAVATLEPVAAVGYIADWLLVRHPPDPEAGVVHIKEGDTPIQIAARYYADRGFKEWGRDERYVVNALTLVNAHVPHNFRGDPVIQKKAVKRGFVAVEGGVEAPWWTAQVRAGGYMWLPGAAYLNAIYEEVRKHGGGSGSITADLWNRLKDIGHYVAYGLAFVGGLVDGFVTSLWEAIAGIASMVYDVLKSIFTLHVVSDVKELIKTVEGLSWKDIKDAVGEWADKWAEKLNSSSAWTAGHAHGYLTGYIMAEAAMLLISGGAIAEAKAALWGSRLGKAMAETRALKALAKGVEVAGKASAKVRETYEKAAEVISKTKAGRALATAREAITTTLKLPLDIIENLTAAAIERLQQLGEPLLKRIRNFKDAVKRWLLGCASECKVEYRRIRAILDGLTDEEIEAEFADVYEEAARQGPVRPKPRAGRVRRTFVRKGVTFELRGAGADFVALEEAQVGAQVYVIRDSADRVMYVGIVEQRTPGRTALDRLREHLAEKEAEFLGDAAAIEVRGVGLEERSARALEDDLITQHSPKWNRRERDPQSYRKKYRAEPQPYEVRAANNASVRFTLGPAGAR
jgi:hypothetical protein